MGKEFTEEEGLSKFDDHRMKKFGYFICTFVLAVLTGIRYKAPDTVRPDRIIYHPYTYPIPARRLRKLTIQPKFVGCIACHGGD